jgi:dinuclear metal center YbgI/SA1388 family protein
MTEIADLVAYCDRRLDAAAFEDYCPNGLQVEAGTQVRRLVSGVTASQALIEAAVAAGADALLVHHGYFWKGEPAPLTGMKGRRIATLLRHGISLLAYHLPLDAHPELGNNRQLGSRLGLADAAPADGAEGLLWQGELPSPLDAAAFAGCVQEVLGRAPLLVNGGTHPVRRLAWCTGGAQGYIVQAAALGVDAYLTGEVSEPTVHVARECGLHFYAAGHHATERYGVQALGEELAAHFGIEHRFIDIDNPA